ncbi:PmoA family protein [Pseudarthrobacter sp. Fe7]|nr:PmoA family protein [Pseudarthrobacter sp. Fe7]
MTTSAAAVPSAASTAQLSFEDDGKALIFTANGRPIATYTYKPADHQYESPRPFFHPLTTLGGDEVTISRPWDHVWHKGLSWALPNVGPHNFWGGATYTRATEYANLDNNGAMTHASFTGIDQAGDGITASESLTWTSQEGAPVIAESRRFNIQMLEEAAMGPSETDGAYAILFETRMSNISGTEIRIGSPTTEGRDNAGYGGLFWRGPRSFTGGEFRNPDGSGTDEFMGTRSPWIAFTGKHDVSCRSSTIAFVEDSSNPGAPNQWFARSSMFACLGSAPFFSEEVPLREGVPLTYRYAVVIADGGVDAPRAKALAGAAQAALGSWV